MNDPLFDSSDGATPIEDGEANGLRLSWVRTRGDLNEAEAANILRARQSLRAPDLDDVLDDLWLRKLHRRMFGEVWSWAGTYRLSERNIGISWVEVPAAVRLLVADCRAWVASDKSRAPVARFHHRLLEIHPFPNGNGRHSRAATDYLCVALELPTPSWGAVRYTSTPELRSAYLSTLRLADRDPNELDPLVDFIWS